MNTTRASDMEEAVFHESLTVIDALEYGNWDRELLEELRRGGLTCVHVTCAIWEDARATLDRIAAWYRRFREHADLVMPVRGGEDIDAAKAQGRTGIVLCFQNSSPVEDDLGRGQGFPRLG